MNKTKARQSPLNLKLKFLHIYLQPSLTEYNNILEDVS